LNMTTKIEIELFGSKEERKCLTDDILRNLNNQAGLHFCQVRSKVTEEKPHKDDVTII
jgi:hypothetical protein